MRIWFQLSIIAGCLLLAVDSKLTASASVSGGVSGGGISGGASGSVGGGISGGASGSVGGGINGGASGSVGGGVSGGASGSAGVGASAGKFAFSFPSGHKCLNVDVRSRMKSYVSALGEALLKDKDSYDLLPNSLRHSLKKMNKHIVDHMDSLFDFYGRITHDYTDNRKGLWCKRMSNQLHQATNNGINAEDVLYQRVYKYTALYKDLMKALPGDRAEKKSKAMEVLKNANWNSNLMMYGDFVAANLLQSQHSLMDCFPSYFLQTDININTSKKMMSSVDDMINYYSKITSYFSKEFHPSNSAMKPLHVMLQDTMYAIKDTFTKFITLSKTKDQTYWKDGVKHYTDKLIESDYMLQLASSNFLNCLLAQQELKALSIYGSENERKLLGITGSCPIDATRSWKGLSSVNLRSAIVRLYPAPKSININEIITSLEPSRVDTPENELQTFVAPESLVPEVNVNIPKWATSQSFSSEQIKSLIDFFYIRVVTARFLTNINYVYQKWVYLANHNKVAPLVASDVRAASREWLYEFLDLMQHQITALKFRRDYYVHLAQKSNAPGQWWLTNMKLVQKDFRLRCGLAKRLLCASGEHLKCQLHRSAASKAMPHVLMIK